MQNATTINVNTLTLHPMMFDEFLIALGRGQMLEGIRESYLSGAAFPPP